MERIIFSPMEFFIWLREQDPLERFGKWMSVPPWRSTVFDAIRKTMVWLGFVVFVLWLTSLATSTWWQNWY